MPASSWSSASALGAVLALGAAAAAVLAWQRRRARGPEEEEEEATEKAAREEQSEEVVPSLGKEAVPPAAGGPAPTVASTSDTGSTAGTERGSPAASPSVTPPASPTGSAAAAAGGGSSPLAVCPWHDALSFFLPSEEICRASLACTSLRRELTVEASGKSHEKGPRRLLLVPVVQLWMETAEEEVQRVSLPHARILRVYHRLSLNAVASAVRQPCCPGLRCLERLAFKGLQMHPDDVSLTLRPLLAHTPRLKLLSLQNNRIGDATVQRLCDSGILEKVETLNLRFNMIRSGGAAALAACPAAARLRWINLKMNAVGDEGALALAGMLRRSSSMQMLNLRRQTPALTDKAALGLAEALRSSSSLQQLRLRRNKISDAGAVALAAAATARLASAAALGDEARMELDLEENKVHEQGAVALLRTANVAPAGAQVELLLHSNPVTRASLRQAVADSGEHGLDASNPHLQFDTKPESELF